MSVHVPFFQFIKLAKTVLLFFSRLTNKTKIKRCELKKWTPQFQHPQQE